MPCQQHQSATTTATTTTATIEVHADEIVDEKRQKYHFLPPDIGTRSNPFHITLNVAKHHILQVSESDQADEAITILGNVDLTGRYARNVCILSNAQRTSLFTVSADLHDGTDFINFPKLKPSTFHQAIKGLEYSLIIHPLAPMLVEVIFLFTPASTNNAIQCIPIEIKPFVCDSFNTTTSSIYPNEELYCLFMNQNIKPGIKFYDKYCSSKSSSSLLSSVESNGNNNNNNIDHNTIYSLYPDNVTPQDILDNPFYPICMTAQSYDYGLKVVSSPIPSQLSYQTSQQDRIIWNGIDVTHRVCQRMSFEVPQPHNGELQGPRTIFLEDKSACYRLKTTTADQIEYFPTISKLTCIFLAPLRIVYPKPSKNHQKPAPSQMARPSVFSLFRVGCDGQDHKLMNQQEKIASIMFRYVLKKKLFQDTLLLSTTTQLPQLPQLLSSSPQQPVTQYNFLSEYPYTKNNHTNNNNTSESNNTHDLGFYYNPIPLTMNILNYHLKIQKINGIPQLLLGNAVITHHWGSILVYVVDIEEPQDGSSTTIDITISDGTGDPIVVRHTRGLLASLRDAILQPTIQTNDEVTINKDFSKLYKKSSYYPLLLEYRIYLCPTDADVKYYLHNHLAYPQNGEFKISDIDRHHQHDDQNSEELCESYELYTLLRKHNIEKGRLFYETYCLTPLQQDAFLQYHNLINMNEDHQTNSNSNSNSNNLNDPKTTDIYSLYKQYHPIFDNPYVPIPVTLQMMNSSEFTSVVVVNNDNDDDTNDISQQQKQQRVFYAGYDVTQRVREALLTIDNVDNNTSSTQLGCRSPRCPFKPCCILRAHDLTYILPDNIQHSAAFHHRHVNGNNGNIIRLFSLFSGGPAVSFLSLWRAHQNDVTLDDGIQLFAQHLHDGIQLLAQHSRLAVDILWKNDQAEGKRYKKALKTIRREEERQIKTCVKYMRTEIQEQGTKRDNDQKNEKKNKKNDKDKDGDNSNKCTCPKQGCILHGDDGYNTLNEIKLFEDNNKLYDKTINDNKQYINELQHKIEKLQQQYNILNKQDRGTPWEHHHQLQQQQQKQNSSSSSSSQKQKDNKKQQSNKNNKKNNKNNDKIEQQSVLYYKSNPQRYPQYIQDKMLEYKQRITILRQQLEQHYITIKQNNTKINNNNNPMYIQKKQQHQILQQHKEEYELLYPTLQDKYNNIQKDLQDIILSNNTIQTKYLLLLNRLKMAREHYQQYNNNNNSHKQDKYIDLYKSLTHLYTTIDMKSQFNYQQQYQNHQDQSNDKQDVINNITPLHTSMIQQQDQININTDNNNSNDIMFLNTFFLSQPNLLVPSLSSSTTTTTVPKLQHGDYITNTSQLLSNNISLPTTIGESLYNTYSHLYHYFTTPSSSSPIQQSLFDQPQPLIYKDYLTLYQSYLNIINTNQNQITQEIYNITKHNYIAHLLPHVELLYNTLTTSIITQYINIYYNDNYRQYYPNILDYWKSLVSAGTIILYHAFLRFFTLSSLFNSFNTTTTALPSHLYHTSQSHYQQQQEHHIISFHSYHQQQQKQYTNVLNSLYQILHDKKQQTTMSKLSDIVQELQQQQRRYHHHTTILTTTSSAITTPIIEKKCCVCFTTASTTTATHNNNNNNNNDFVTSTCCQKMIVCCDCIPIVHDTKCAHCGQSNATFL